MEKDGTVTETPESQSPINLKTSPGTSFSLPIVFSLVLLFAVFAGLVGYLLGKGTFNQSFPQTEESAVIPSSTLPETSPSGTQIPVAKEDPTKDWKTYTNSTYGFEFKYPSDWQLNAQNLQDNRFYANISKTDATQEKVLLPGDNKADATYSIIISVENNPNGYTAKEYYLSHSSGESRAQLEKGLKDTNIAGIPGISFTAGAAPSSGLSQEALITYSGKIYRFAYGAMAHPETHLKYLDVYNQILSTFRFLD